jgi:hypothetical protein
LHQTDIAWLGFGLDQDFRYFSHSSDQETQNSDFRLVNEGLVKTALSFAVETDSRPDNTEKHFRLMLKSMPVVFPFPRLAPRYFLNLHIAELTASPEPLGDLWFHQRDFGLSKYLVILFIPDIPGPLFP